MLTPEAIRTLRAPGHLDDLPRCIDLMRRKEAPPRSAARSGDFSLAALEQAVRASDDIH